MIRSSRHIRTALITAAVGATLSISSLAVGDEIIMQDGRTYTGDIVSKTRRTVVIDTDINGIKARISLDRREIKSLVEGTTPTTPATTDNTTTLSLPTISSKESEEAEAEEQVIKRDGYRLLLEVPIEGTFGEHVYPLGIAHSLEWAVEHDVTDIVFRINSPGGEVWAAQDMVAIMERYEDDLNYHMLIEHAISASIWPSFTCDTITMAPGATFGGAVVFRQNGTGSAEVDLKMTSIMAAKLGSQAESNGHSEYLVKSMMISEEATYAYMKNGEWVLTDSLESIPNNTPYDTIDGPDEILTLTTKQATKYGLVNSISDKSLATFAEANGIDKWDDAGKIGATFVNADVEKSKNLRDDLRASVLAFHGDRAWLSDTNRISSAGAALQNMRKSLGKYKRLMKKAQEFEMPSIVDSFGEAIDVAYWEAEIESQMATLRRYRKRGP